MSKRAANEKARMVALAESQKAKIPRRSSNDKAQNALPANIAMQPESNAPVQPESIAPVPVAAASFQATTTTQRPREPGFSSSRSSFSSTSSDDRRSSLIIAAQTTPRGDGRSISLSTPPEGYAPSSFLPLQNQADASSQHPSKRSRRNGSASGRDSTSSTNSDGRRSSVPLAGRLSHSPPLVYTREGSTSPVSIA